MELGLYRALIHQLAITSDGKVFYNKDADHAEIVLTELIEHSKNIIRIFAAQLYEDPPISDEYIRKLSDFIENGGVVRILLNSYDPEKAKRSELFKRLAFYISQEKDVKVKYTLSKVYYTNDPEKNELHFTIGDDKAYRIETNIIDRAAEGSFNNEAVASKFIKEFDNLFEVAKEVNLIALFNI